MENEAAVVEAVTNPPLSFLFLVASFLAMLGMIVSMAVIQMVSGISMLSVGKAEHVREIGMSSTESSTMMATWLPNFLSPLAYFVAHYRSAPKWNSIIGMVGSMRISLGRGTVYTSRMLVYGLVLIKPF